MIADGYRSLYEELNKIYRIPGSEADGIKNIFRPLMQRKGDKYVSEGEVAGSIAFLVSGLYKYYYIDKNGNEYIKHFSKENDFVASYKSFIMREPSPYSIEALEDSRLLTLQYSDYMDGFRDSIFWQNIARGCTERMLFIKEERERSFMKDSARERYINFLRDFPELEKRVRQKQVASYLGITPESLSRIKNHLKN